MTTRIEKRGRGSYRIDGKKALSVTTVLSTAVPKQLTKWAAETVADRVVDEWDDLVTMTPSERRKRLVGAPFDSSRTAAHRGTRIHALGEAVSHGRDVTVPDELVGPVEAYARFMDRWDVETLATETPLGHPDLLIAGTSDLWCKIGRLGTTALVDLKTGKGVYNEAALQLAAYRHLPLWQPRPGIEGETMDVDACFVAHIGTDDVRLVPVDAGEAEWREFRFLVESARWIIASKDDSPIHDALDFEEVAS